MNGIKIKQLVYTAIMIALIIVGSWISINIGVVPITLQTLFVILAGIILGPKRGALAVIIFLIMGLVGLPVFAGGGSGLSYLYKPTFGFLIGFIFMAFTAGVLSKRVTPKGISLAAVISGFVPYIFGLPYLYYILNFYLGKEIPFTTVLKLGFYPFILGDIIKIMAAIIISLALLKQTPILRELRNETVQTVLKRISKNLTSCVRKQKNQKQSTPSQIKEQQKKLSNPFL